LSLRGAAPCHCEERSDEAIPPLQCVFNTPASYPSGGMITSNTNHHTLYMHNLLNPLAEAKFNKIALAFTTCIVVLWFMASLGLHISDKPRGLFMRGSWSEKIINGGRG